MGKLIIPISKQNAFDGLELNFKNDILKLVTALKIDTVFSDGLRTFELQNSLYSQGRDSNGNIVDKSKVVTNAKAGQSAHNYGIAVDLVPVNPDTGKADWNYANGFKAIADKAKEFGLNSGYFWNFKDSPHIEKAGFSWKKYLEFYNSNKSSINIGGILVVIFLIFILYKLNSK